LALGLARLVVQRSQRTGGLPSELHRSLAVVDLSGDPLSRTFARRLTGALSPFGPTQLVDAQTHPAAADDTLHPLEDNCRFVVYDPSGAGEAWCRAALDRVDEVLFVADAARAGTQVRPLEDEVAKRCTGEAPPHRRLVLVHEGSEPPATGGTRAWLVDRDIDDVHHARIEEPDDMASLTRILAGRAVSVVLGGGAARGFAHLGVLRALEELGVPVDQVGGSSIGAVIAAGPAMGRDSAASTEDCRQRFRRIIDRTLPVVSFASGKRLMGSIAIQYGAWDIEDLWRPFFCVSTSLTRNRTVVHRRGPLGLAIRASVAIPGVFPPFPHDGELLVDGSLLDNLPVAEMRRRNPTGTIIAVDVAPAPGRPSRASYGGAVSGWRALGDRLRRRGGRAPGLAATVLRAMMVASSRDRDRVVARGVADLYLDLDIRNCGPFDFHAVDIGRQAGYDLALPRLAAWLKTAGRPWETTLRAS
jgi:predicted acylesterase/phospholipase RssA